MVIFLILLLARLGTLTVTNGSDENQKYFNNGQVVFPGPDTEPDSIKYVTSLQSLEDVLRPRNEFEAQFLDFLRALLQLHPDNRITAHDVGVYY